MLLFGSLPGPWLTLAFPAAVSFAIHDRRALARLIGVAVVALIGAVMTTTAIGGTLLAAASLAQAGTTWIALKSRRRLGVGETALPAIAGAAIGLALGAVVVPDGLKAWETALEKSVIGGGEQMLQRYRALGLDAATLQTLEDATGSTAALLARLWPALAALALWLGAWLGYRLLARWGHLTPRLRRRLGRRSFERFRLGEPLIWGVIAALAALWLPSETHHRVAANALLVGVVLYGLQGFAVGAWWMNRREASVWTRILLLGFLLVFLSPVLLASAVLLGLAEHWLVLRDRVHGGHAAR